MLGTIVEMAIGDPDAFQRMDAETLEAVVSMSLQAADLGDPLVAVLGLLWCQTGSTKSGTVGCGSSSIVP